MVCDKLREIPLTQKHGISLSLSLIHIFYTLKNSAGVTYATVRLNNYKFINLANKFYTFRHVATLDNAPETPSAPSSYSCLLYTSTLCIYKGIIIIQEIMPTIKKLHPIFGNSPLKRMQSHKL